jgi:hypothetical protein
LHTGTLLLFSWFEYANRQWIKQDILQLLNEGKIDTRWQQFIAAGDFKTY